MIELLSTTITVNLVALISFIVLCCTISNILNLISFKKLLKQILDEKEKEYVRKNGMEKIRNHAEEFIRTRISPAVIKNDGKQTPMRGHPVFKAQHATACCCRKCLNKWYKLPMGVQLTDIQQTKIVNLIMAWIEKQMNK